MPAITWALVTTRPGPTTKPEPSWICPHPSPTTLTVEAPALATACCIWVPPGRGTGPADGASCANASGKPSDDRKLCTRENTDGGAGSTSSRERMMRDSLMEELRWSEELTSVLANSQITSSEATTATPTPSAESTVPSLPRCTRTKTRLPTIRPATAPMVAAPSMVTRATLPRAGWD